jgi:F-type H+-transporting ATPase subunit epsilon
MTCFWGFCEVLPDKVNVLAELGERAEQIDMQRAEAAKARAEARLAAVKDEAGYAAAHAEYVRAVTRVSVGRRQQG